MNKLKSLVLFVLINMQRGFDHLYRGVTGLPRLKRMQITPNMYLGGQYDLRGFGKLRELGVTGIVNMRMHSIHEDIAGVAWVKILNLPTVDQQPPTMDNLQKGVAFIKKEIKNGGKVYIHCRWGEGRGPSMAIAYLMSTGLTLQDAIALIKKARTFINPSTSQLKRLKEFEKHLQKNT